MDKYICENCNKKFTNKRNFNNHISKKICLKKKRFTCSFCNVSYKNKFNLKEHLINKHHINNENISEFIIINENVSKKIPEKAKCPLCDNFFNSKNSMKYHLKNNCPKIKTNIVNNVEKKNTNNNFINNGTVNNITNNNITYNLNINIKPFGEEKIDSEKLLEILETVNIFNREDLVKRVIKQKHIDTPENRNVYVNYKFGKIAIVLDKKEMKWKKCEKNDIYNKIRCNVIDDIDDCMYTNKKHNVLISNQIKKLNKPTKKINKKYYEDVNSLFFNNKNILEKSYKEQLENN